MACRNGGAGVGVKARLHTADLQLFACKCFLLVTGLSTPIGLLLVRVFYLPRFTFVVLTQKSKQKRSRLLIFSEQNLRFAIGCANRTRPKKGAQTGSLSLPHRFMAPPLFCSLKT